MLSVVVNRIFSSHPSPILHYYLRQLHNFLQLNISAYIPPSRLHTQLVSVPICTRPDMEYVTDQDFLATPCDIRIVRNLAY